MRSRILLPIMLVVVLQVATALAVLGFGGEYGSLREYAYRNLVEKTQGGRDYLQDSLQEKMVIVQERAGQLERMVTAVLEERGASVADLQTDRELAEAIIRSSVDMLSTLIERVRADDVYLILNTDNLFAGEGGEDARAALYLQAPEVNTGEEDKNPLVVFGSGSIADAFGFERAAEWSENFVPNAWDREQCDFYYKTLETAQNNRAVERDALGYWSRFSEAVSGITPSMKYSLPLIAPDGTVYGVVGVGFAQTTVWSGVSSGDLRSGTACYLLAYDASDGSYDVQTYTGSAYRALIGGSRTLHVRSNEAEGVYRFDMLTDVDLTGSIQPMGMYSENSPYADEQWALISVANSRDVQQPVVYFQQMLITSVVLSLIAATAVAIVGTSLILKPLSDLSRRIRTKRKYNEVIRFEPTNIYEIDDITDAITQMQINVQGFSSQVSKMITIADVGMGSFMYDRTDDSVFVGQSLIKVLRLNLPQGEDIVMSRQEFLDSFGEPEILSPIAAGLGMSGGEAGKDFSKVNQIHLANGDTLWMRLSYTYSPNTAVCIVQDITDAMIERNRIEYERDYDSLTGLLNRHAYYRTVEKMFRDRNRLKITAFIMIDLDNLKYVNDTYGHDYGDDYIKTAARVLKKFQDHGGVVSHISGDEFTICLPGFSSKEEVREIIAGVRGELLNSSFLLADGSHYKISASMGVSWYPDDAESREMLMKYADFAMYTVKHSTKGEIAEFDQNAYGTDSVLLTGVAEMKRIIEESSVKYAFQPIVSTKTGEIYGYEALMRVQSEIFQSPPELLRAAKTGAKLYEIERLTWTRALADFQTLIDAGRVEKNARLFINSIANNKLEPDVEAGLEEKYAHLLNQIVIEILENESSDEECNAHKAQLIQKWGGRLALDDFGTGYNSEFALLSLRPNIIKIDCSIVSGCDQDTGRRMIIENLVKLSRTKGILVLAEGVETEGEMRTVIACGVDYMQGFYLARPTFAPEPIPVEITDKIRGLAGAGGDNY